MKLFYIVKGATQGDNVYEHEAVDEKTARAELESAYAVKNHSLTIEFLSKTHFEAEAKRILRERQEEANK